MQTEINGTYILSSDGKIYSKLSNKYLKPYLNTKKYACVTMFKKDERIHRLVAEHFIPNPNNLPQVNHIDGNKLNNDISNLEWVTNRDNVLHYHNSNSSNIYKTQSGKFYTKVYLNKKQNYIGVYSTIEEAKIALSTYLAQHTS
jgi:hypothetical protein